MTPLSRPQAGGDGLRIGTIAYRDAGTTYVRTSTVMEDLSSGAAW